MAISKFNGLLLLVLLCAVGSQGYQLEVVLRSYRNPLHQRSSGHCCDNGGYPECPPTAVNCLGECDPYFTINATSSSVDYSTPVYPNTKSIDFPSTSAYVFHGEGMGILNVTISINDHDEFESHYSGFVAQVIAEISFSINVSSSQQENCSFHNMSRREDFTCEGYAELNISYRVIQTNSECHIDHPCHEILPATVTVNTCSSQSLKGHSGQVSTPCATAPPCICDHSKPTETLSTSPTLSSPLVMSYSCPISSSCSSCSCSTDPFSPQPTRYPQLNTTCDSQPNDGGSHAPVYTSIAIGSFLAGTGLTGTIFLGCAIYLKMRARKRMSKTRSQYFSRRERNPFYQSAEDLVGEDKRRGANTPKDYTDSPDNVGDYDTLRGLPLARDSGKLLALNKKENGYFYCLSPTDPPVPLRPVPSERGQSPEYEAITYKSQGPPHKLMQDSRAQKPAQGAGSSPQYKNCPIYEMCQGGGGELTLHMPSTPPPSLPRRKKNAEKRQPLMPLLQQSLNTESGSPSPQISEGSLMTEGGPTSGVESSQQSSLQQSMGTEYENLIPPSFRDDGGSNRPQSEEGIAEESRHTHQQQQPMTINSESMEQEAQKEVIIEADDRGSGNKACTKLYAAVKKRPKSQFSNSTISKNPNRLCLSTEYPPSVPPYCVEEEEEEEEEEQNSNKARQ